MDSFAKNSNHTEENDTWGRTFSEEANVPHSRDHPAAHELVVDRGIRDDSGISTGSISGSNTPVRGGILSR
jgi:hypothetical protein